MLRRQRTAQVNQAEAAIMVTSFTCHDEGALKIMGSGVKESAWQLRVGEYYDESAQDLEIKLSVDMAIVKTPKVRIEQKFGGKSDVLYPTDRSKQKDILKDDFQYTWPFRGVMPNIGKKGEYEVRLPGTESWFPARLDKQRPDGNFEVTTFQPLQKQGIMDGFSEDVPVREVKYDAIGNPRNGAYQDIRFIQSKKLAKPQDKIISLTIPVLRPLEDCVITADDGDASHMVTHFFARPTPCPAEMRDPKFFIPQNRVTISVDKARSACEANIGHSRLLEFLSGQPRYIAQKHEKLFSEWKFTVGLATHTIRVEKKYKSSKIVTLSVDGEVLVDAAAKDIDHEDGEEENPDFGANPTNPSGTVPWVCSFKLVGQVAIDFNVFPTNRESKPIGDATVKKTWKKKGGIQMECRVALGDHGDCRSATLHLGTKDQMVVYQDLDEAINFHEEPNLRTINPKDLEQRYGASFDLRVPWAVDESAQYGLQLLAGNLGVTAGGAMNNAVSHAPGSAAGWLAQITGLFSCFCKHPPQDLHEQRMGAAPAPA